MADKDADRPPHSANNCPKEYHNSFAIKEKEPLLPYYFERAVPGCLHNSGVLPGVVPFHTRHHLPAFESSRECYTKTFRQRWHQTWIDFFPAESFFRKHLQKQSVRYADPQGPS